MLILTQDRLGIINLENILEMYAEKNEDTIRYYVCDKWGNDIRIAEYTNTPEHENQIERIAEVYGAINTYVMPKGEL